MSILLFTRTGCLGNDIIDLTQVFHTSELPRQRMLDRVLASEENRIYQESSNKIETFAILWAAKESAFKAISAYLDVPFSWKDYIVNIRDQTVVYGDHTLIYQLHYFESCIHVIATGKFTDHRITPALFKNSLLFSQENSKAENESDAVRHFVQSYLKTMLPGDINISKEIIYGRDIPVLMVNGTKTGQLSLSHHGDYHGFAYLKEDST